MRAKMVVSPKHLPALLTLGVLAAAAAVAGGGAPDGKTTAKKAPADNLEFWLNQARTATTQATQPASEPGSPFGGTQEVFRRPDALPGVVELSDGRQLPGGVYTTIEKPWIVWSEDTKSWRRVPFLTVLSIAAVVEEERMELNWRWKGMGEPEKVYTGEKYPLRRLHWKFRLIDGSVVEGATKGQPLCVELQGRNYGPFVLHERMKGENGQTLQGLVYVKKVVVSRKMMDAVLEDRQKQSEKNPSPGAKVPAARGK